MTRRSGPSVPLRAFAWLLTGALCGCATRAAPTPVPPAAPTPKAPPPAAQVPEQPYIGTPRPVDRPYLEILRLKESGESNTALLEKVRKDGVMYSLSTFDIQKLRASGVSEDVIAAMLASGRESRTPTPRGP